VKQRAAGGLRSQSSHVVGFDDAPFDHGHRGDVLLVGAVYAGARLDGVLSCKARRDGVNWTGALAECVRRLDLVRRTGRVLRLDS
jgi:hypothetical protein